METSTITVAIYRTPSGAATCCRNLEAGDACRFLRTQRMGLEVTCLFAANGQRGRAEPLDDSAEGYLIPCDACPLHHPQK